MDLKVVDFLGIPAKASRDHSRLGFLVGNLVGFLQLKAMKVKSESEVVQSCPTLCDPMDWSLPGSSVHDIFQARVLEWVAISFSKGSS